MCPRCTPSNVPTVSTVPFATPGRPAISAGIAQYHPGTPLVSIAAGDRHQLDAVQQRTDCSVDARRNHLSMHDPAQLDVVGADVVEVIPTAVASTDITALVADRIVRQILNGIALRRR